MKSTRRQLEDENIRLRAHVELLQATLDKLIAATGIAATWMPPQPGEVPQLVPSIPYTTPTVNPFALSIYWITDKDAFARSTEGSGAALARSMAGVHTLTSGARQ